tara:strand:+ start:87 stop:485 length:399 start_codon:yes stop_codon:yes gene_type:complete
MKLINFMKNCGAHTFNSLFPTDIENKGLVYLINVLHILGVAFIQFGVLLPSKLLIFYILFVVCLFISYYVFNNRCFMTIVSNKYSKKNINSLCISMAEAKIILFLYLVVAIIGFLNPAYSLYSIIYTYAKHL